MKDVSMEYREKQKIVELLKNHCIRYGDFTLHSGERSTWICDLLLTQVHFRSLMVSLGPRYPTVGIELGGLLLAQAHGGSFIRKDGTYYPNGYFSPKRVSLVDDVVTTERSMVEASLALDAVGIEVGEYLCVLDRRAPDRRPDRGIMEIRSLVTAEDLGLSSYD